MVAVYNIGIHYQIWNTEVAISGTQKYEIYAVKSLNQSKFQHERHHPATRSNSSNKLRTYVVFPKEVNNNRQKAMDGGRAYLDQ